MYDTILTGQESIRSLLEPPNGTTISAEAGTENVTTIRCDIHTQECGSSMPAPRQVQTAWYFENNSQLIAITDSHPAILLHGRKADSLFFSTFNNLLTLLLFEPELNNTALRCGHGEIFDIGSFPLIVFSKH